MLISVRIKHDWTPGQEKTFKLIVGKLVTQAAKLYSAEILKKTDKAVDIKGDN